MRRWHCRLQAHGTTLNPGTTVCPITNNVSGDSTDISAPRLLLIPRRNARSPAAMVCQQIGISFLQSGGFLSPPRRKWDYSHDKGQLSKSSARHLPLLLPPSYLHRVAPLRYSGKAAGRTARSRLDETPISSVHSATARRQKHRAEGALQTMYQQAQKRNPRRLLAWFIPPCPTMIGVYSFWPRICDCSPH